MRREDAADRLFDAFVASELTVAELAEGIDHDPVWTAGVLHGAVSTTRAEAETLTERLEIGSESLVRALCRAPEKGQRPLDIPSDPMLYRLFEIPAVYGDAIKTVVHEEFGDGIMSAIDFECHVDRIETEDGADRVRITYEGAFLPYRRW